MNTTTNTRFSRARELHELGEQLIAQGIPEALASITTTAIDNIWAREDDIRDKGAELQGRIERTIASVDAGRHINDLGELQGAAPSFDIACARRQDAIEAVKRLAWALDGLPGTKRVGDQVRTLAFGTTS